MPSLKPSRILRVREHQALSLVLLFALIHGLIYVFLVPPWQHYDEPTHFEFAWLIANREGLPRPGEYDQAMRRELAASMIEHDFFRGMDFRSNLLSISEPIWIGISQINDRPLFYILLAAPLWLVRTSDITFQLYLGRLVSLLLYLVTILAAYGVITEFTQPSSSLRWTVPAALALLPGLTDIMTAINDDVGATAFFSLFVWVSLRLIQQGFTWFRLLALFVTAALCFWTKNTVTVASALMVVPVLFSLLRGIRRSIAWLLLAGGSLMAFLVIFAWGDPAQWYRQAFPDVPARASSPQAPHGSHSFQLILNPGSPPPSLAQLIPPSRVQALLVDTLTLGAWIWASETGMVRTPILDDGTQSQFQEVQVGTTPTFFAFKSVAPENPGRVQLILSPIGEETDKTISVYYDGILLVAGERPEMDLPLFEDDQGQRGWWGDRPFTNMVRNASAEQAWPWVHPWVDQRATRYFPGKPSLILSTLLDWRSFSGYYNASIRQVFQTFWAKFGWGHVGLMGYRPYRILGVFTLAGLTGAGVGLWRKRREIPSDLALFLGLSLVLLWGETIIRGSDSIFGGKVFIPSARYGYPAIIPTLLILTFGWLEILYKIRRWLRLPHWAVYLILFIPWLFLDVLSVFSILRFYSS